MKIICLSIDAGNKSEDEEIRVGKRQGFLAKKMGSGAAVCEKVGSESLMFIRGYGKMFTSPSF